MNNPQYQIWEQLFNRWFTDPSWNILDEYTFRRTTRRLVNVVQPGYARQLMLNYIEQHMTPQQALLRNIRKLFTVIPLSSVPAEFFECYVCMENIGEERGKGEAVERPVRIKCCDRICGQVCLEHWLKAKYTCPNCRKNHQSVLLPRQVQERQFNCNRNIMAVVLYNIALNETSVMAVIDSLYSLVENNGAISREPQAAANLFHFLMRFPDELIRVRDSAQQFVDMVNARNIPDRFLIAEVMWRDILHHFQTLRVVLHDVYQTTRETCGLII